MLYLIYIHHTAHQYQPSFPTPTLFRSSRNNRGDERRINPRQLGFVQPQTALGKALCYAGQRAASSVRRYALIRLAFDVGRISAEAEEADQRVVIFVPAAAGGQRDLRNDVVARFTEQRIVLVLALLLREPQRPWMTIHG